MRSFRALTCSFGLIQSLSLQKNRINFGFCARLGRSSWISRRRGRSRDRFWRPKRLYFGVSWPRSRVRCLLRPKATKHCKNCIGKHIGASARQNQNDQKSASERSRQGLTLRTCSVAASARLKSVPGAVRTGFGTRLGTPGRYQERYWAVPGASRGALGRSWARPSPSFERL